MIQRTSYCYDSDTVSELNQPQIIDTFQHEVLFLFALCLFVVLWLIECFYDIYFKPSHDHY